ncbi:MAG TPA: hypothetical protein ENN69_08655 [Spirochaetia bacterium]|nr:hypothetical protein [Spirochaetia bacterium]
MEETNTDQGKLIEDIREDAAKEAAQILADAERTAEERKKVFERQIAELKTEAEKSVAEQIALLEKNLAATFSVEKRRITLHARDRIFKEIMERIERRFFEKIKEKNYPQVLLGWITEAAIGLGAPEAVINASASERPLIDKKLLERARAKVKELTHRDTVLTLSAEPPLLPQGIVLSSADGRTAFNNQVRTRLKRNQSRIQKLIYDRLLGEEGEE